MGRNVSADLAAELALQALDALRMVRTPEGDLYGHALRAAAWAIADAASPSLVAATLLHDIGHGFDPESDADVEHPQSGADWLGTLFGREVTEPVRLHVDAKRYLAALPQAGYVPNGGSATSLSKQGGAMSLEECARFERSPFFVEALRLRGYDDQPGTSALPDREALRALLAAAARDTATRAAEDDRPLVYVGMCADIIHRGHINILNRAAELGRVVVGVLTDNAIASYKPIPLLDFRHRCEIVRALRQVNAIVAQVTLDYRPNLLRLRPKIVVHGDDWRSSRQAETRLQVIETLALWDGKLVEPSYTPGVSSSELHGRLKAKPCAPADRCAALVRAIRLKPIVRVIEAHSGFSALIADRARVELGSEVREFDGLWSGSLTSAAVKGRPDTGIVDFSSRMAILADIVHASDKPILFDAEEGGGDDELKAMILTLERHGVSAVVVEDKVGPKRNSLMDRSDAKLADLDVATHRIHLLAHARHSEDLLVIARLEGMVFEEPVEAVVQRALRMEAVGADMILPHSKRSEPAQVLAFAQQYRAGGGMLPLVAIPTTYSAVTESELLAAGFSVVVYANQLLRAAMGPMMECALDILERGSAGFASQGIAPVGRLVEIEELEVRRAAASIFKDGELVR